MRETRQRKNGGVIFHEEPPKKAPTVLPGFGDIEVTAPQPLPSLSMFNQRGGRRVMNHYQICLEIQALCGALVDLEIDLLHLLCEMIVLALKGVRQSSGCLKEFLIPCEDLPARIDAQGIEHRHQPSEDFRHAAAITTCADMQKTLPCDLIAQAIQKLHRAFRRIVSIFI